MQSTETTYFKASYNRHVSEPDTRLRPLWWIKLTNYEYWPWLLLYVPILPVWVWNVLRTRSLTYFTAVNPGWKAGGFYGASKKDILDLVPAGYKPKTVLISKAQALPVQISGFEYPLIAKPDVGARGHGVTKIHTVEELMDYHLNSPHDYIVQEYVSYKTELGILYSRMPGQSQGLISSVTMKEFLSVTGDGRHTLEQLVQRQDRARFQQAHLSLKYASIWKEVLAAGQKLELESIGNHCRGTRFINANYLINNRLHEIFDHIADQIPGFQYGRYDLRVSTIDDLYEGKNIRVVELNGVNADPAHIYDNSHGLLLTFRDLAWHWLRVGDIAKHNLQHGVRTAVAETVWRNLRKGL
jgi:hypothetical protein